MENLKAQNIKMLSHNTTDKELFKPPEKYTTNYEDFNFPQGKDINFLSEYYNKKKGNADFIDKISKLNKKFYNCSENYIKSKKRLEKLNDDLYMNLFKQINCYVEEIERLNKKIASNNTQDLKKTIDKLNKEIHENKEKIRNYELKLKEKTENEDKLIKEIESYKRRITFYKDKINIQLLSRSRDTKNKNNIISRMTNQKYVSKNDYIYFNSDKKLLYDKNNLNKDELSLNPLNKIESKDDVIDELEEKNHHKTEIQRKKLRESIYKQDDLNELKRGKNFSDLYDNDNDMIEKREEENSDNALLNLNIEGYSEKIFSKYSNQISHELLSNKNIDDKNKTFDSNKGKNVYDNQLKKDSGSLNALDTKQKKNEIKSKILNVQQKDEIDNKDIRINMDMKNISSKSGKLDKSNKTKPSTNNYKNTKYTDSKTPNTTNKYTKKLVFNRIRPVSIKADENRKVHVNNDRLTTHQNQNVNKLNLINNKDFKSTDFSKSGNKLNIDKRNQPIMKNKIISRYDKNNNKDMNIILKVVNDDYINSIEMLKIQEEQIKAMLKLMDLNEK